MNIGPIWFKIVQNQWAQHISKLTEYKSDHKLSIRALFIYFLWHDDGLIGNVLHVDPGTLFLK